MIEVEDEEEKLYWEDYAKAEALAYKDMVDEPDDARDHFVRCMSPCCSAMLLADSPSAQLACDRDCQEDYEQSLESH